jgi:hypothetical protein
VAIRADDFLQDIVGLGSSDEGLGTFIMLFDVGFNGGD